MPAYCDPDKLRLYIPQGATIEDEELEAFAEDATALVDAALGFSFDTGDYPEASDKVVYGWGQYLLNLPPHKLGSVASVTAPNGQPMAPTSYQETPQGQLVMQGGTPWPQAQPYLISARWGYGPPPADIVQVTVEVAKNLIHERDSSHVSDVVGITGEGGTAIGYKGAFTKRQQMVIDKYKALYSMPPAPPVMAPTNQYASSSMKAGDEARAKMRGMMGLDRRGW